jgi:hypothetical protein
MVRGFAEGMGCREVIAGESPLTGKSVGVFYLCSKPMPSKRMSLPISVF